MRPTEPEAHWPWSNLHSDQYFQLKTLSYLQYYYDPVIKSMGNSGYFYKIIWFNAPERFCIWPVNNTKAFPEDFVIKTYQKTEAKLLRHGGDPPFTAWAPECGWGVTGWLANLGFLLLLHGDQTQVARHDSKHLYPLSYLTGPMEHY